jgi:uncharacterized protein (TIGR02453 family)
MPKAVAKTQYFTPELFAFLLELRYNNTREWFATNKPRYEALVKKPLLSFIEDLAPELEKINPQFEATNHSMFRIHRDTRFSADKSPYKTQASAQFRHRLATKDVHMPGFYLHLEPENCFLAAGMWMPEPANLARIRAAIARQDYRWLELRKKLELDGEGKLKRPPKGYTASHPMIEDLKQRSFTTSINIAEEEVCSEGFMDVVIKGFRRLNPLNVFLSEILLLR